MVFCLPIHQICSYRFGRPRDKPFPRRRVQILPKAKMLPKTSHQNRGRGFVPATPT
ncbi:unnamed protein product, partial [Ascophyllum nodosum]